MITWHKGDRLLTAGPIKVYSDDRMVVDVASNDLILLELDMQDAGDYFCQINTKNSPSRIKHTLVILGKEEELTMFTTRSFLSIPTPHSLVGKQ